MADRTPEQQKNSDVCDNVLKFNERIHTLLTVTGFITKQNPTSEVQEVLDLLKRVDAEVSSLDRGPGHITLAPKWV